MIPDLNVCVAAELEPQFRLTTGKLHQSVYIFNVLTGMQLHAQELVGIAPAARLVDGSTINADLVGGAVASVSYDSSIPGKECIILGSSQNKAALSTRALETIRARFTPVHNMRATFQCPLRPGHFLRYQRMRPPLGLEDGARKLCVLCGIPHTKA